LNVLEKGIGGEDVVFSSRISGERGDCGYRVVDVMREMNCGAETQMNCDVVVVLSSIV
jgi:hypothetical protein